LLSKVNTFPNPYKDYVDIVFWLSVAAEVNVKIYTVSGEVVAEKAGVKGFPGNNSFRWDGRNSRGKHAASGVYIYRIEANSRDGQRTRVVGKLAAVK
jgi:flagellar hook assembly protein FlgD